MPLPFLTEADPDKLGEGSIDPLGLATIAERLANTIAPDVTARMNRIRFLTAIAVGAVVAGVIDEEVGSDLRTPPYLAFEWLVVESFARKSGGDLNGVPGIGKAGRMLTRSWDAHLDAASYLQVPKVFGFHGVYKRLSRGLRHIDDGLILLAEGDELVRVWEREQRLPGFADCAYRTPGGRLVKSLRGQVISALTKGRVTTKARHGIWRALHDTLAPGRAGRRERKTLWDALTDEQQPVRRELVMGLRQNSDWETEASALRALASDASMDLRTRLVAIERYERVAGMLTSVFRTMQRASTGEGLRAIRPERLRAEESVVRASKDLPGAMAVAAEALDSLDVGDDLERQLGVFSERHSPAFLVDVVLSHHEGVQEGKGGKRPWIERSGKGFYVRPPFRTTQGPPSPDEYVHPYRVGAISRFIEDLKEAH